MQCCCCIGNAWDYPSRIFNHVSHSTSRLGGVPNISTARPQSVTRKARRFLLDRADNTPSNSGRESIGGIGVLVILHTVSATLAKRTASSSVTAVFLIHASHTHPVLHQVAPVVSAPHPPLHVAETVSRGGRPAQSCDSMTLVQMAQFIGYIVFIRVSIAHRRKYSTSEHVPSST